MANSPTYIAGIVLAGGKSQRMGQDKALIPWQGQTLLAHVCGVMDQVCSEVFISSPNPDHEIPGCQLVQDLWEGQGPMGGIASVMQQHPYWDSFMVVAVDLPFLEKELLKHLLAEWNEAKVTLFEVEDRLQPTLAIYHRDILFALTASLNQEQNSLTQLIKGLPTDQVNIVLPHPGIPAQQFYNHNHPQDLEIMETKPLPSVKVLFFGYLAERISTKSLEIKAIDLESLKEQLHSLYANLKDLQPLFAVNQEVVHGNFQLNEGDEVALMPPFAGG